MRITLNTFATTLAILAGLVLAVSAVGCNGEKAPPRTVAPQPTADSTAAFAAFVRASDVPVARVPAVASAPKVDGVLDEAYKKGAILKFSLLTGADAKLKAPTTVYVISTAKELCIFARCETPNPEDLLADIRDHDGQVWNDDCIELFIDPTNQRKKYGHIQINSIGTTADAMGSLDDQDSGWDPELQLAAKVDKKAWVLEIVIPFSELGVEDGQVNRVWAANFNRMAYLLTGTEDTAWSPTGSTNSHVPEKFGVLWLDAGTVDNTK